MAELKKYPAKSPEGKDLKLTVASGPVIIKNNKILLSKHGDDFWKIPGGTQVTDQTLEQNAIREAKEELSVDVKVSGEPFVIEFQRENEFVILFHFLAKIVKGKPKKGDVDEIKWFNTNKLPKDCAPNIKPVVKHFSKQQL